MNSTHKYHNKSITATLAVVLFCLLACNDNQKPQIEAFENRAHTPLLIADTVTTLISDSGITRYRLQTARWEIYDKAEPAYWEFPQGIYMERFNEQLQIESSLQADYAFYNEDQQLWELDGNVKALNLEGEYFETQQLFWNQKNEQVYSDSLIKITRQTSIITGIGFESNQAMSKYTIRQPQGVFPIKEDK